ncbi:MAG: DNA alkylation repair protein [Oscillospiraceae bacterium]|nr:DNA alkylation repair protein [Oscillospiraceae bacterium]
MTAVRERLFALRDEEYRAFSVKLLPTLDKETVLGVRSPALRAMAKELSGTETAAAFLAQLPHRYHEENCLHAFLIERIRDYDACVAALDAFQPRVDNWAVCDCMNPPCLRKKRERLLADTRRWLDSGALYTMRFALRMLMAHFLDADFRPEVLDWAAEIETEEYYLRMMQAWFFATALAKRWDETLPYIEGRLEPWTHNKAIRKAVESDRISAERKAYLKTLKIKR